MRPFIWRVSEPWKAPHRSCGHKYHNAIIMLCIFVTLKPRPTAGIYGALNPWFTVSFCPLPTVNIQTGRQRGWPEKEIWNTALEAKALDGGPRDLGNSLPPPPPHSGGNWRQECPLVGSLSAAVIGRGLLRWCYCVLCLVAQFSSVQSLSPVRLFATPSTAAW